jgi:hypothetical protein
MIVLAVGTLLWYVPVISVTCSVHLFIPLWRSLGMKSYWYLYTTGLLVVAGTALLMPYLLRARISRQAVFQVGIAP